MDSNNLREQQLDAWLALTGQAPMPSDDTVRLPVLSGSMLPGLPIGAHLEIQPAETGACRVGDVVVFLERRQRLTAHRVLALFRFGPWRILLQKGDNNPFGHWIREKAVRGRVRRVVPASGDDSAAVDPFDPVAAAKSLRSLRRNLIRYWPRRIRDFLRRTEE